MGSIYICPSFGPNQSIMTLLYVFYRMFCHFAIEIGGHVQWAEQGNHRIRNTTNLQNPNIEFTLLKCQLLTHAHVKRTYHMYWLDEQNTITLCRSLLQKKI